jgi:DNA polymerase III subunit epsilon
LPIPDHLHNWYPFWERCLGGARARGAARTYARAAFPSRRAPWAEGRYCVLDLELSGLDPRRHEIIAFGAIPVEEGRVHLRGAASSLVRPSGPLTEESIRVHGIRGPDLADAPALDDAIELLLEAMAGRVLVAHYARIEREFLGPPLRRAGVRLRGPVLDTADLAPLWLADRDGAPPADLSLTTLARACGLPAHSPHTALGDALTTAKAFIALASLLDTVAPQTVGSLVDASRPVVALRRFGPG